MKAPLKLFLFIFMAGGLCLYFIFYFLIYLIFMLLVSVVQGLTCFTFNFLFEQDAVSLPLWIILLPVVILIGIGIAISEVFKTIAVREMRFMI